MNDYTSILMAAQRHREFIREAELDRLAEFASGKQKPQRREEFTAATTHSSEKSRGIQRLVPVSVGSIK